MATDSLTPADKAAQTMSAIRQILGATLLWGLLWFFLTASIQPEFTGFLAFLHLSSPVFLAVLSVFLWRMFTAYRASI